MMRVDMPGAAAGAEADDAADVPGAAAGAETEDATAALFSPRAVPGETADITSACSLAPPVATPVVVARADVLAAAPFGATRGE
jgi:hypothetical protein